MLENTYDNKNIVFGILTSRDFPKIDDSVFGGNDKAAQKQKLEEIIESDHTGTTKFDSVDGLTIKETLDTISKISMKNTIIFVAQSSVESDHTTYRNILYTYIIRRNESNEHTPIEQEIERIMMNQYQEMEEDEKRYVRCFLQRYKYEYKSTTDNRIGEFQKKLKVQKSQKDRLGNEKYGNKPIN